MRQRLGLAAALLRRPRLLVLDEPTNGLDPQGIHEIRELLLELNAGGTTVFVSSHLLTEVEQLCTRVGVLDRGRLVLQDELATLRGAHRPDRCCARPTSASRCALGPTGRRASTATGWWCAGVDPPALVDAPGRGPGCGSARSPPSGAAWRTWCCR